MFGYICCSTFLNYKKMKLVKLTLIIKSEKDRVVMVNPSEIAYLQDDLYGTIIVFSGDGESRCITVRESLDDVVKMINPPTNFDFSIK